MRLYCSSTSPFVRKVLVVAHEIGIADRLELVPANPRVRPPELADKNPLGKIPVLVTDDGAVLFDSPVICEYLDSEFGAGRLVPKSSPGRWQVLADAALADGLADAALLYRNEATRTDAKQPSDVAQWQLTKMLAALDRLEAMAPSFGALDIVQIGFACALGWIEFRMPDDGFVSSRPKTKAWFESISRRPSFQATAPKL